MSTFSERLKFYLERSSYTISSFAKSINIERTLLQKYTTGSRIPKNSDFIDLISDKLLLSVQESIEIHQLWKMESIGPRLFQQREKIKEMLIDFKFYNNFKIPEVNFQTYDVNSIPEFKTTTTKHELIILLRSILSYESNKETFPLSIYMQPKYSEITQLLIEFSKFQNLEITHLVCFHQQTDSFIHNVSLIEHILNLSFCIAKYNVKVYYDDANHHVNQMSIFPNLIITDEFVISFSYDLEDGIIYHKNEITAFYQNTFNKINNNCKLISRNCNSSADYQDCFFNRTIHYGLTQSPQIGMSVTPQIYNEFIVEELENRDEFIYCVLETAERLKKIYINKKYKFFFTDNGLNSFINEGRNSEFPNALYRPLSKKIAATTIDLYCKNIADKYLQNIMLNNKNFNYTSNIIVYLEIGKSVIFQMPVENDFPKIVIINEPSFNEMMIDFFESMEEMEYSHSYDYSTLHLEDIVRKKG